ncbi:hypothetical protein J2T13_004472 [Paenibacillus sp. DS2015]|uniref:DUF4179 domain-containing protein n=1 Tax=Paenibacillus sp. DS2015 TaxID=3373917 RepID=UPI003D1F81A9
MDEKYEDKEQEFPQLEAMKGHIDQLVVPREISEAVQNGMGQGRVRRRRRVIRRMVSFTACLLVLVSIASVRFSPVVAAYVSDIPGLRSLVQLINNDKGLQLALENDFMQSVDQSIEHDGIKLTVDSLIIDKSRVIVFYTLDNMDGRKRAINLVDVKLLNYTETSTSFGISDFKEDWESKQGTFDISLNNEIDIPDNLDLNLRVGTGNRATESSSVFQFEIPVDKEKFAGLKETYDIDQTVIVEGQRISFGTMTIYPTRIGLEVAYDPSNTKKLFSFDDIRIEDEHGETFGTITNGISSSLMDDNRQVLYFQSNYFRKPDQLYLRASSIRALDKSKLEVLVDLDRKVLLTRPDDKLTFDPAGVSREKGKKALVFHLKNEDPLDENRIFSLFDTRYKDATGQSFESNQTGETSTGEVHYYIEKADYTSPLKLTISDYPSRIRGDINLRIK